MTAVVAGPGRSARRAAPLAAVAVVAVALLVVGPMVSATGVPRGIVLEGAEQGAVTGLLALGLVLTYRATRIVNFAAGAMGSLPATLAVMLFLGRHWNWFGCLAVAVVAGALTGLVVEVVVIRRFAASPRLVLTVATIGVAQVLGGLQLLLPGPLHGPTIVAGLTTPLSGHTVRIAPALFNANDLLVAVVVPVAVAAMAWFLLRTDAGVAVRAAAENEDRARLLGIPVRRLSTLIWVLTGALAALAVVLSAPSQGLVLTSAAGPDVLLPALAAAVVAGMESLPWAFGAGVGLGVINALVAWHVSQQSVGTVVTLGVILVALLLRRRPPGVGDDQEGTWSAVGVVRPLPEFVRSLPVVRAAKPVAVVLGLGVLAAVAAWAGPGTLEIASNAAVFAMIAVSLVVLTGWGGNISLGQYAIAGFGGIVAGDLLVHTGVDLFVALVVAGLAGGALAVVVGLPALRIRGLYLAVTTLAFAVAADAYLFNPANFPSLIPATVPRPGLWHNRFTLVSQRTLFVVCAVGLVATVALVRGLRRARAGRVQLATRDNPRAAAAMGVPTVRVRLGGFVIAGIVAGVAGALEVLVLQGVGYNTFDPASSVTVFTMAVIGGIGSVFGAVLGVGAVTAVSELFPGSEFIIVGAGVLVLLLFLPGGLAEGMTRLRDRAAALLADRARRRTDGAATADTAAAEPEPVPTTVPVAGPEDRPPRRMGETVPVTAGSGSGPADRDGIVLDSRGLEFAYGAVQVLFGVDLEVHRGEILALLGTNGAGKSTVLRVVAGLRGASGGAVTFEGRPVARTAEAMARRGLSLMPGGRGVFPSLTVEEHLRLGAWMIRKDEEVTAGAVRRVYDLFPVLEQRSGQAAGTLSGGEQQMLSLALCLMTSPRLLLIDELSLGLAPSVVSRLLDVVRELREQGTTVVIVEQSVNVALELADRAVFLEKGEVRFTGPTAGLLDRPDILRAVFLAGLAPADTSGAAPLAATGPAVPAGPPPAPLAVGEDRPVAPQEEETEPALEVRGLSKRFGAVQAVDHVDLAVPPAGIVGLIGHNGAGKTTLFDLISGFLPADGGDVRLHGRSVARLSATGRAAAGLGRSFQEARLFPTLTVDETIAVALERHLSSREPVAAALRLPASLASEAEARDRVDELTDRLGLGPYRNALVADLSTGTRRVVELACMLAGDPDVVLLDEPSAGIAQREVEALAPLLLRVKEDTGCAMLVIEHDLPLLTSICDELVALELGAVIARGLPELVIRHEQVIASYLGSADGAAVRRSGQAVGTAT